MLAFCFYSARENLRLTRRRKKDVVEEDEEEENRNEEVEWVEEVEDQGEGGGRLAGE